MKRLVTIILVLLTVSKVIGQQNKTEVLFLNNGPINIGLNEVKKGFVPPSDRYLKSGNTKTCTINVTYVDFPENAKHAFEYAKSIWESNISSTVPISVIAKWEIMSGNELANSRPSAFFKNFAEALVPDVYYPISLAEKLSGKEKNGDKEADIVCSFNNNTSWYFGTDGNTPSTKYDFITVVLHEMAHGFGISGFLSADNGIGDINNRGKNPSVYDYYIFNKNNQRISDNSIFICPSTALYSQLTSSSLTINGDNQNLTPEIFAPSSWRNGVSIYHLESNQSNSTQQNELMGAYLYKGLAIHNPGENTINVLSAIGWNNTTLICQEIKDIENTSEETVVFTKVKDNSIPELTSLKVVYSTNNFTTQSSAVLTFNQTNKQFEGKINTNNYKGKVKYYFSAVANDGKEIMQPSHAPEFYYSFKIGADYYSPQLFHNQATIVWSNKPVVDFKAVASDNIGIGSVKVEYQINGVAQEPFLLKNDKDNVYTGSLEFPVQLTNNDQIQYRIVAEDNSSRKNKKFSPVSGLHEIKVFETLEPVTGYQTDFNNISEDFTTSNFEINVTQGFNTELLCTSHPYPQSEIQNEKINMVAQLNYPVILEENGQMSFDEVVLVEPGQTGTNFKNEMFRDYVIIEGSKDNGQTWIALTDGYDSSVDYTWESQFTNTLKSSASSATGQEDMFLGQVINLTEHESLNAGDTVIIRFRLSADNSINGWGWGIDNLKIQSISTAVEDILVQDDINIYPNPFKNEINIDCRKMNNQSLVEIIVTDLYGKTVFHETNMDIQFQPNIKIDLSNLNSGFYFANIIDSNSNSFSQKIVKI